MSQHVERRAIESLLRLFAEGTAPAIRERVLAVAEPESAVHLTSSGC